MPRMPKSKISAPVLSGPQLEIMGVLWDKGEASISQIAEELGKRRTVSRATLMVQILRLERRKWLKRRKQNLAYLYRPARARGEVAGALAAQLVDSGFGGSTSHLVQTLVDVKGLTQDEIARLKKLVASLDQK